MQITTYKIINIIINNVTTPLADRSVSVVFSLYLFFCLLLLSFTLSFVAYIYIVHTIQATYNHLLLWTHFVSTLVFTHRYYSFFFLLVLPLEAFVSLYAFVNTRIISFFYYTIKRITISIFIITRSRITCLFIRIHTYIEQQNQQWQRVTNKHCIIRYYQTLVPF